MEAHSQHDCCPHCHEQLGVLTDAFCPFCHGELRMSNEANSPQSWIISAVMVGLIAITILPLMAYPLIGIAFLGIACFRPAMKSRKPGWIIGAVLGATVFFLGLSGPVALLLCTHSLPSFCPTRSVPDFSGDPSCRTTAAPMKQLASLR